MTEFLKSLYTIFLNKEVSERISPKESLSSIDTSVYDRDLSRNLLVQDIYSNQEIGLRIKSPKNTKLVRTDSER